MFTVYYSNQLSVQKTLLLKILDVSPNPNPFESEIILVQSQGMVQWLQLQIASEKGIAANFDFVFPNSFLWQQYRLLFPQLPKENIFERNQVVWRLMRIIPTCLSLPHFSSLNAYLGTSPEPIKLFQLAEKIAELFDQYLVYRPNWLIEWENHHQAKVRNEIERKAKQTLNTKKLANIETDIKWQADLWNLLIADIKKETDIDVVMASHRAYFQQKYFDKLNNLSESEKNLLPKRIFVFGISSLPMSQLETLTKLSEHCDVHLFFTTPCQYYWGNVIEQKTLDKIALKYQQPINDERSNDLLAVWGKQGKDFYTTLVESDYNTIDSVYVDYINKEKTNTLLSCVQQSILDLENKFESVKLDLFNDNSIQLYSCHSELREVEVLHNRLLDLFNEDPHLTPKDIIVMSPDIDKYAPYIHAVFSRYARNDSRYIPFTLSDQKETTIDPIIASFIVLLDFKESVFSAETILDLLDITAVQEKFDLSYSDIQILRYYIQKSGIRGGVERDAEFWENYNSWENGIERLLLGIGLKSENGIWQETIAFDESYGLTAELVGKLSALVKTLSRWKIFIQNAHFYSDWKNELTHLISMVYAENESSVQSLLKITQAIDEIERNIIQSQFNIEITIDVLQAALMKYFDQQRHSLSFLTGKVNFCTLLPMRAIPFKVVCLLGMNESDFPRQQSTNSFDLMQYAPQRGDRARRDDDRYLFLEALLSAEDIFYISYIGQSLTKKETYLPSIVVSQLLDFLEKNHITQYTGNEGEFCQQSMMPFSQTNFDVDFKYYKNHKSYDGKWCFEQKEKVNNSSFLLPLDNAFSGNEIELEELISYVQNPIKYFFNRQLGIYFKNKAESIAETEIFSLSNLENYAFYEQLLSLENHEIKPFFEQEKLKGLLPASAFSDVSISKLEKEIRSIRAAVSSYCSRSPEMIELSGEFNAIKLVGQLNHQFGKEVVLWRVGALRDKDLIQMWIYHLLLSLKEQEITLRFFYKEGENAKCLTFNSISPDEALAQLAIYVQDYIHSFKSLRWAIYQNLIAYFNDKNGANKKVFRDWIEELENGREGEYLSRILAQNDELNESEIEQTTTRWFDLMVKSFNT